MFPQIWQILKNEDLPKPSKLVILGFGLPLFWGPQFRETPSLNQIFPNLLISVVIIPFLVHIRLT